MKTSLRTLAGLSCLAFTGSLMVSAADDSRAMRHADLHTSRTPQRDSSSDRNQVAENATGNPTDGVSLASAYAEDRSLRHYAGLKLVNTENAELGTIKDFVVHAPTGQVRYAVVSTGGRQVSATACGSCPSRHCGRAIITAVSRWIFVKFGGWKSRR
jgi:hypothetical protein